MRSIAVPLVIAAALAVPAVPAHAAGAPNGHRDTEVVVAADGSGDHTSVQAAVDGVPDGQGAGFVIRVEPGVYHGPLVIGPAKSGLSLKGATGDARDVVITDDRASGTPRPGGGTYGTSGSATAVISADDVRVDDLTFENAFDEAAHPEITSKQAVALRTTGDRLVFDGVRFLGNQDTLYVNSPDTGTVARQYYRDCYVEGDVDFIFGRGTAVFDRCEIRSLDRGSGSNNGYITAASTQDTNPYGFLIHRSRLTSDAPAGTVHLGRPWHPGGAEDAIAQVLVRDSVLGAHIGSAPWTDMSGFSWREARFAEFRNRGPGARPSADRPRLPAALAAAHTPRAYLAGQDGWDPVRGR